MEIQDRFKVGDKVKIVGCPRLCPACHPWNSRTTPARPEIFIISSVELDLGGEIWGAQLNEDVEVKASSFHDEDDFSERAYAWQYLAHLIKV